ncbi:MAG: tyrosine--tRNA ligase, partial [Lachnospiraceae bacterium]|nr:tyrosine--tRNA ligase [Lachnospiraceae bacterium]
ENMPSVQVAADAFNDGSIDILGLLVAAGMATSRNEARRAVEQGGVTVNGEKVEDAKTTYTQADFAEEFILKKGKKKFCKVTV